MTARVLHRHVANPGDTELYPTGLARRLAARGQDASAVTGLRLGTLLADGTMGAPPAGLTVVHHDIADDDRHGPVARVWLRATAPGTHALDVSVMTVGPAGGEDIAATFRILHGVR